MYQFPIVRQSDERLLGNAVPLMETERNAAEYRINDIGSKYQHRWQKKHKCGTSTPLRERRVA